MLVHENILLGNTLSPFNGLTFRYPESKSNYGYTIGLDIHSSTNERWQVPSPGFDLIDVLPSYGLSSNAPSLLELSA